MSYTISAAYRGDDDLPFDAGDDTVAKVIEFVRKTPVISRDTINTLPRKQITVMAYELFNKDLCNETIPCYWYFKPYSNHDFKILRCLNDARRKDLRLGLLCARDWKHEADIWRGTTFPGDDEEKGHLTCMDLERSKIPQAYLQRDLFVDHEEEFVPGKLQALRKKLGDESL